MEAFIIEEGESLTAEAKSDETTWEEHTPVHRKKINGNKDVYFRLVCLVLVGFFAMFLVGSLIGVREPSNGAVYKATVTPTPLASSNKFGFTKDDNRPWFEKVLEKHGSPVSTVVNTIPTSMMLIKGGSLLWCPNAKVGTTTLYKTLELPRPSYGVPRCLDDCNASAWKLFQNKANRTDIIHRAVSFTHVRNPWDRLRSCYENKIATGKISPDHNRSHIMSFSEFVAYVEINPYDNIHWMPFSHRCLTSASDTGRLFHYDHIIRLEDGMTEGLLTVLRDANLTIPVQPAPPRARNSNNHTEHTIQGRIDFYRDAATEDTTIEELVAAVGRVYKKDASAFRYSFDKYN